MTPTESIPKPFEIPPPRRTRIGGSEIGAVLGCDPYRDGFALWTFKRGLVEPVQQTPRMRMGQIFEPAILQLYSETTGREIVPGHGMVHHLTIPYMVFSPDALCVHEKRGIDAKLVSLDQRFKFGDTVDDIPEHIQLQCHWYMAALDFPVWDVAAFIATGDLKVYTVERDLALEEFILGRAEEYWRRYLVGDEIPPMGASRESERFLKERFPRHKLPLRLAQGAEIGWLEEYGDVRAAAKQTEERLTILGNQIKLAIGDGEGLEWQRGRFTWKATKDTTKTDWERLAQSLLKDYAEDERAALAHQFTETRPGYRRIYYRRDGDDE